MSSLYRSDNWKDAFLPGLSGGIAGFFYAFAENYWKGTALYPLMIRASIAGFIIIVSITWFDMGIKEFSRKLNFMMMLLVKSVAYFLIITFVLMLVNGMSQVISYDQPLLEGISEYFRSSGMYIYNLITLMIIIIITNVVIMINSLHRPNELISFVLGRYHHPREVDRIFLFIDLNNSTTIAEEIGNIAFGRFLQAYYSDVSVAVRHTQGMIYDYIGDEVIISWKMRKGLYNYQCVKCFFMLEEIINNHRENYREIFGHIPQFKAGMHSGSVVVMWVGNDKKEIVYLGDVLNTTKRIQAECSRLEKKFLISGSLMRILGDTNDFKTLYHGESQLKGKQSGVAIFSIEN